MEKQRKDNSVFNSVDGFPDHNPLMETYLNDDKGGEAMGQESREEVEDMDLRELDLEGVEKAC